MTTPIPDRRFVPVLQALVACACAQLAMAPRGPVCHCCVVWGDQPPPADVCACECVVDDVPGSGQAWTRLVSATASRCGVEWGVEIEIGVLRCVTVPDDMTGMVPCVSAEADAVAMAADMQALIRAARCCPTVTPRVVSAHPVGPSGGCAGSVIRVVADIPGCPCPPTGE